MLSSWLGCGCGVMWCGDKSLVFVVGVGAFAGEISCRVGGYHFEELGDESVCGDLARRQA